MHPCGGGSRVSSHVVDLADACEVAAALKAGGKPGAHDLQRLGLGDRALADRENISVVVRAIPDGELFVPADAATDAADAIRHDGFTVAGAAEDDAALIVPTGDRLGDGTDEV